MDIVKTEQLTKIYGEGDNAIAAVDGINLNIKSGEFLAVMGPSGCGKSTLLHLIGSLDRPSSGKVFLDGKDISTLDDKQVTEFRRQNVGFIFQFFNLIPVLTALENASLPLTLDGVKPADAKTRAIEWLSRVGLKDRMDHRPDELSGGQQQRVAIARALVHDPALILADEPTGNLDSRSSDELATLLRQIVDDYDRTVLMVTHDPRIAAVADRIVFLKDGSIVDETYLSGSTSERAKTLKKKAGAL
jgi:putative ABC transport system ATP-binding protein